MRLSFCLALSLSVALIRAASYKGYQYQVKEKISGPPRGWIKGSPAPPDHTISLKIALVQPDIGVLEQHLWEVSDPDHERYGAHLSKAETEVLMAPHPASVDAVNEWLASHGFEDENIARSSAKDWVTVHGSVSLIEEMLNTTYHVYHHQETGDSIVRTTAYSLPDVLHEHIDLIQPTTMFARLMVPKSTPHRSGPDALISRLKSDTRSDTITGPAGNQVDADCQNIITLTCLWQLYNSVGYEASATNGNKLGITGYLDEYANVADLHMFLKDQNPQAEEYNFTLVSVNGGLNNQSTSAAGLEANMDTQFGFGLSYPTPGIFYSTAGKAPYVPDPSNPSKTYDNEPFIDWLNYTLAQSDLPQTISTSYGDVEASVPRSYANRACIAFAALGARGVSILVSSGDDGIGDGTGAFVPQFPSSCPYVTSVGGTRSIPEIAASFSGGGFSNYFERPDYQAKAVSTYLDSLAPGTYAGLYNPDGRGIPDVAAQAVNFRIIYKGSTLYFGGTSLAAPTFASFVSMLNDARIKAEKPPLGFLNPMLYAKGYAALNDVTQGNNPGTRITGFNASTGWDPVTGFGTPDFQRLKSLVLSL
ncbi:peptidase S8/S53 domain-containing protein [Hygrophoropsis aurantiaca]|uniref:Peptidase S8/S53 domain-containing protein n=1 Tax=Hygrophoropsis aurantiaca TaxID=72124 RepID=A0ACB8A8Z2_9AGAM|nr:peptidase S8/S53 domain-containing protein [Hygrophoropsis aurantiaca]